MYHGPIGNVLEFFGTMGFQCPERKGVADFLQEVVSKNDQQVQIPAAPTLRVPSAALQLLSQSRMQVHFAASVPYGSGATSKHARSPAGLHIVCSSSYGQTLCTDASRGRGACAEPTMARSETRRGPMWTAV